MKLLQLLSHLMLFFSSYFVESQDIKKKLSNKDIEFINTKKFELIIINSSSDYHLIYSYNYGCPSCEKALPKVLDFLKSKNNIDLYLLLVGKINSHYIRKSLEQLTELNYNKSIYISDPKYDKKVSKRYKNFIKSLVPNRSEFGLSLFLLFDKNRNLLFESSYKMSEGEIIKKIINITSKKVR